MRCSQCNRDQTAGKFCIKCGGKLLDAPTASTIRCTRCNTEQSAGKFCMNCGEKLLDGSTATATVSSAPAPATDSSNSAENDLLNLPDMNNLPPGLLSWQNKQLQNFIKSVELAKKTVLEQAHCANCNKVIPKDDNCGEKDGKIYCSACLNTPLVLLGMFKKK